MEIPERGGKLLVEFDDDVVTNTAFVFIVTCALNQYVHIHYMFDNICERNVPSQTNTRSVFLLTRPALDYTRYKNTQLSY